MYSGRTPANRHVDEATVDDFNAATYGDRVAQIYDQMYPERADAAPAARALAKLAPGGRALELGIGTGRIALPLAAHGVVVQGIDASAAMVAKLRAKPGGAQIPVTIGDFADFSLEGEFDLIYVVFNTLFALQTQDAQVACFRCVAKHLAAGGVFVVEAFVPDVARFARGQDIHVNHVHLDHVTLSFSRHDAARQLVTTQIVGLDESGIRLYPLRIRYGWPSELDLMAELAGLRLRERWSDWDGAPFTSASDNHVSVYARRDELGATGSHGPPRPPR